MRKACFVFWVNDVDGEIMVRSGRYGDGIGKISFTVNRKQGDIHASSFNIDESRQRQGLGSACMAILQSFASRERMVITLCAAEDAIPFYKKCGFVSETARKHDPRVIIENNGDRDNCNMYWIPSSMSGRKKVKVYL